MFERLIRIWERLRHSLWILPLLFGLVGSLLAGCIMVLPDLPFKQMFSPIWPIFSDISDVRNMIGMLLPALVTMFTLALSITMVVLTLAAQNLGPRLIRNFLGDHATQSVIGIFVANITFLVTALLMMGGLEAHNDVAQVAGLVGALIFVISLFSLIVFVHHLGRSIVSDQVIIEVGDRLEKIISETHDRVGHAVIEARNAGTILPEALAIDPETAIQATQSGYIQGIDYDGLCKRITEHHAYVELIRQPGEHVLKGEVIGRILCDESQLETLRVQINRDVAKTVMIGNYRTAALDVEFSLRQIVEIAVRALSPGINDPFTAIASVYRLGRALRHTLAFVYPIGLWMDDNSIARLSGPVSDFSGMLGAAIDQIRQAAAQKPDVLIPIAQTLEGLIPFISTDRQRDEIRRQAKIIINTARREIGEPDDCRDVEKAARRVLRYSAEWHETTLGENPLKENQPQDS
ncbi:DUF2254 domain-containing protein [Thalassospira marina]|uniref:DUF2254 domain-containing protein n=1 Tax=Thalassospira marina TaxID=2048283 RepID=A0A2N3KRK7_9PROT|nr:DUF2254 domain-containing protein [Thalassospira marina]PKR53181.1 hypothetical protein COO20_16075 [Thalassospira marina]